MKYTPVPLLLLLISCTPGSLSTSGPVHYWSSHPDTDLQALSTTLPGLQYSVAPWNQPWTLLFQKPSGQPDLILSPLSRDLIEAGLRGDLLSLRDIVPRMKSYRQLPESLQTLGKEELFPYFLPVSIQPWVLVTQSGTDAPGTLEDLEAQFRAAQAQGRIPLALGSSFGWTALGLFAALDISRNGPEAYLALYKGSRSFSEASLESVYGTLVHWRDAQWVDPAAGKLTWQESLQKVSQGKAAYAYLPAGYVSRAVSTAGLSFYPFPSQNSDLPPASLAVIQGYAVRKQAPASEAALALADAYISAGVPGVVKEPETRPAFSGVPTESSGSPGVFYLPALDTVLPAQGSYTATRALSSFFSPNSRLSPRDLREILETLQN